MAGAASPEAAGDGAFGESAYPTEGLRGKKLYTMKRLFLNCTIGLALFAFASAFADDAQLLTGKWSVKKTNDQGQSYTQTIEIKNGKFTFEIVGTDDQVVIHAVGDVKLEKLGPFSSAKFHHIRAGNSESSMEDVDDEYVSVYVIDSDSWTMATNFDKQRERQKPSVDVYKKTKAASQKKAA